MSDVALTTANTIFKLCSVGGVIAGVITAICAYGVFWSGGIRDRYADDRIAQNEAATARANAEAATANAVASVADAKAAEMNLAYERLKEQVSWRQISKEQAAVLLAELKRRPSSIIFAYTLNDSEALYYMSQLSPIFRQAGWTVTSKGYSFFDMIIWDNAIISSPNRASATLQSALDSASIKSVYAKLDESVIVLRVNEGLQADVTLFIGSKKSNIFEATSIK